MKNIIKVLTSFLILSLTLSSLGRADDPVPWPSASRCPFPWNSIDGYWNGTSNIGSQEIFEFKIVSITESGSKIIQIKRFDNEMRLISEGKGIAPAGQNVVRFAMFNVGDIGSTEAYTVFVGKYGEKNKQTCTDNSKTVVTVRSFLGEEAFDTHFMLERRLEDDFTIGECGQF